MTETTREGIERALEEIKADAGDAFPAIMRWDIDDVVLVAGYRILDYDEDEKEAAWEAGADYVRELEMYYLCNIASYMYINAGLSSEGVGDWAYATCLSDYASMEELKKEIAEMIELEKTNMED